MKNHTYKTWVWVVIAVAGILAGCQSSAGEVNEQNDRGDAPVQVNIALNGKLSPLFLAQQKGWFEEEFEDFNVEVAWSEFPSGPPLLESLASNRVDLSLLGDGALIAGIDKQLPFEVIAQTSDGGANSRILVQKDGNIKKLDDLKGKTVGVASGTTAHVYLIKALKTSGLTTDDVKMINLQPDDGQAAFESKKLDAWVIWNPYYLHNVEKGTASVIEVDENILAPGAIIARTGFAEEHPKLVETYVKVYQKAADWQIHHPDEAAELYAKETNMPKETIKKMITADQPNLFFTEESINAQQESINTLADVGYIKESFRFKEHIHNEYLDAAVKEP
ncbi:ABC transporter substrate-binding protein [Bacillus thermotolerans]|uniref:ABC transporter substrate-binding protein n=1 Tax=Bacillus thermotolerans TaxID=1221996 RepID=UPI0005827FD4|nr:aliphatic sulfonate ABC transporter substrate-binding protein [Bacillus thermotolerans]KKB33521.1 Alkanesulfonates-binding protein [Bacillus thermotolerans]